MNAYMRVVFACLLSCAAARAAESPPPRPVEQPLAVFKTGRAENVRRLLDTVTAGVFGLSIENKGGRFPAMATGPESYGEFLDALIENAAEELWYALPQNGAMTNARTAGAGWRFPEWKSGRDGAVAWLEALGVAPDAAEFDWNDGTVSFATDRATLEALTGGNAGGAAWSKRLAEFLRESPESVGLYFYPRPVIGALSMVTGKDIRSEMARLRLNPPHSGSVHAHSLDDTYIGFDVRVDGLFTRPPYLTDASRYTLVPGEQDHDDMARITIAEPLPYLELLGLDRNLLYPFNLDMLAFVPDTLTVSLWMDEYRHWNWSVVGLVKNRDRFKRQYRRLTGWIDLLAKTPISYIDMDMVETPDGEAVRRIRIGDFEFCLGVGENDRFGTDYMTVMASGRAEDFPGVAAITLERGDDRRLVEWDVKLGEDSRYALADYVAYHLRRYNANFPGIDVLETAIPPGEKGTLRTEENNLILTSPAGMAAWLLPVIPEVGREIGYRMLP